MSAPPARRSRLSGIAEQLRPLFDPAFYAARYPEVAEADALDHYVQYGLSEGRDPNPFFDVAWYRDHNPDVAAPGIDPLLHYMRAGAAELRNPHPRFDAAFYVTQHPEAAANPLVFHMLVGHARGFPTQAPFDADAFLSARRTPPVCPPDIRVDVVIPCYRGLALTRRCIESVLADPAPPAGRVILIDDASPERDLSAWLRRIADARVVVLRNARNRGFVASANRGIAEAGSADVVLLNADTAVPPGWLCRLAAHAYAEDGIATVSPWSNNATICSYPTLEGGPPFANMAEIDAAAWAANAGRRVAVPTTVGFCMYIRRAALADVGFFDEAAFGRGYGEEVDFCQRAAARGWRHVLACDTYVEHAAEVSFGTRATRARAAGGAMLDHRWPDYQATVQRYIRLGAAEPFRFALTAELFRRAALPVHLLVSHRQGGGVRRHIELAARRLRGEVSLLLLQPSDRGMELTAPGIPGHGAATIPVDEVEALARILRATGVVRVHVHHIMGLDDVDLVGLIRCLGVPFDVTVHDWFLVCPQVNLLPHLDGAYCGEPEQAACNRCIADRPSHGAKEVLHWRARHEWLLRDADRVLCPTEDARRRVLRYCRQARVVLAPHEPPMQRRVQPMPLNRRERLRVAVLGVLAGQKGLASVLALAEMAPEIELILIGYPEAPLPRAFRGRIRVTGAYDDTDLPSLIAATRPHVAWFPAQWPETWSYTLSAALAAGLPAVASRIGAFPERLEGRALTWLVPPDATAAEWQAVFGKVRAALSLSSWPDLVRPSTSCGVAKKDVDARDKPGHDDRDGGSPHPIRVIAIPERFPNGVPTPCAYTRLIQPLHRLGASLDVRWASPEEALRLDADIVLTHRHAVARPAALIAHCRAARMRLIYDLDDDLLRIPREHEDAALLRAKASIVRRMLSAADAVWVSTPDLASMRQGARVIPNGIDERLWPHPGARPRADPVRILFMGTTTHGADFALVRPALARLHAIFGERISIDLVGVTTEDDLPRWIRRFMPAPMARQSYPAFVDWLTRMPAWDIGIAPLADTAFNRAKSSLKALDYAALGLAAIASDVAPYRGLPGIFLVPNTEAAWFDALQHLIRHPARRAAMAAEARANLLATGTLGAQLAGRLAAFRAVATSSRR